MVSSFRVVLNSLKSNLIYIIKGTQRKVKVKPHQLFQLKSCKVANPNQNIVQYDLTWSIGDLKSLQWIFRGYTVDICKIHHLLHRSNGFWYVLNRQTQPNLPYFGRNWETFKLLDAGKEVSKSADWNKLASYYLAIEQLTSAKQLNTRMLKEQFWNLFDKSLQ